MSQVLVPVRFPLTKQSQATLGEAIEIARERDAALTVLHVNLFQKGNGVSRRQLKDAVEEVFGSLLDTRYVVRKGLLVEETILEEVAAQNAEVVVIGKTQAGRWREMVRRLVDDPDIERFLEEELDCQVVTVSS